MKPVLVFTAVAVLASGFLSPVAAALTPQQERMKTCNAEAKDKALKGDERKSFMKECLSTKKAEAAQAKPTQKEKMKSCNQDATAKNLAGDERKKFMGECLKG